MNKTVTGILTYYGCTDDVILNYTSLTCSTVALATLCYHLQAQYEGSIRYIWILLTLFLLLFQIGLCLVVSCSGISIIWSSQIGLCWFFIPAFFTEQAEKSNILPSLTLVGLSSLLASSLWTYYYLTAELLTTVAHACAVLLGALCGWLVHRYVKQRASDKKRRE